MVEVDKVYAQDRVRSAQLSRSLTFLVVAHLPLLTLQLVLMTWMTHFKGVFALFTDAKKVRGSPGRSLPESSWTAAYERSELVDDNGHVWVRLDTVHASFWKNLDTQHSQWHPPWEL